MDASKMIELQAQMRHNQEDLQSFMKDLDGWEKEMKAKDEKLKSGGKEKNDILPPVRNSLLKKKRKKKTKKSKNVTFKEDNQQSKSKNTYDYYKKWDKFDVDKECEKLEGEESSESFEEETDEEWEDERKKQQAVILKDQGNQYFKEGKLAESIECYTQAISYDPTNVVFPANRAMALLKQKKYAAAENDCTLAISIDPTFTKAYYRRAMARKELKKYEDAKSDFHRLLVLDPTNKAGQAEMNKIELILHPAASNTDCGVVKPIFKHPSQRSKKPLRRINIEEIGVNDETTKLSQKQTERVSAKDKEQFDNLVSGINKSESKSNSVIKGEGYQVTKTAQDPSQENFKNSRVLQTSPSIPQAPTTSYQFQTDWKSLRNHKDQLYQYFKEINPSHYSKLFGEALESNLLMDVIQLTSDNYESDNKSFEILNNLCNVKRFSMTTMFLSSKEKQVIEQLLSRISASQGIPVDDITKLAKSYDVKLNTKLKC